MADLWIPGAVADELHSEKLGRNEAQRVLEFTDRLKAFDERLELVLATRDYPGEGIRQGFYYILRNNEDGSSSTWEVHDEGAWREPDERDIEALRKLDLRNPANLRRMREERHAKRRDAERRREAAKEERVEDMLERLTFRTRTQIPFNHSVRDKKAA